MKTIKCKFIKRYKRFLVDMKDENENIFTCYTNNTGRMEGLLIPGSLCLLVDQWVGGNKTKYQYKWVAVFIDNQWIGTDTHLPNKIVKIILPELYDETFKPEVTLGNSRIDFVSKSYALEVKNVHWSINGVANFPDCTTKRGSKHVKNLMEITKKPILFYVIQRFDVKSCTTNKERDEELYNLVQAFKQVGTIRAIKVCWTEKGITKWEEVPYC